MTKESVIGTREERLKRIGGSEFATVLDINKYSKRIELVLEKAGVITNDFQGNDATRRGELLEDIVIELFEKESGLKVTNQQKECILNPENCLQLRCHLDGITSDGCVFEAKTTDIKSKTWKNGIPDGYKAQLEFNCNLSGMKKAYIAVAICEGEKIVDFKYYPYESVMSIDELIEHCRDFTSDVEKYKSFGVVNNGIVVKSEIEDSLIDELTMLNEKIAEIEAETKPYKNRKKEIEEQLKKAIGNNSGIETDMYKITMSNRITSPTLDYKVSRSILKIEYK